MKFSQLEPGMIVYEVRKQRLGNTTARTHATFAIEIIERDLASQRVMIRWNGNAARWTNSGWTAWRKEKPVMVKSGFGQRPATRAELKAMKDSP